MESQSRSDASRANGAKSKGPSTPEGKARSSQNARKHGLTARFDILPGESQEDFDALLEAHLAQYQPSGDVEKDLVHTLAITRWRLRRVPTLESDMFANQESENHYRKSTTPGRLGFVFRSLVDTTAALTLLMRYETSLLRTYERTFKHLAELQKLRNEPNPAPPSPTSTPQSPSQPAGHHPPENPQVSPHPSTGTPLFLVPVSRTRSPHSGAANLGGSRPFKAALP